jgi:hypothetical protein
MPRLTRLAYGLVLTLGAAVRSAHADTVNLSCHGANLPDFYVRIDESTSTAAAWITGYNSDDVPANTAMITTDRVTWTTQSGGKTIQYRVDRATGVLTQLVPGQTNSWKCTKAGRVF